jgi:hypothetical protein
VALIPRWYKRRRNYAWTFWTTFERSTNASKNADRNIDTEAKEATETETIEPIATEAVATAAQEVPVAVAVAAMDLMVELNHRLWEDNREVLHRRQLVPIMQLNMHSTTAARILMRRTEATTAMSACITSITSNLVATLSLLRPDLQQGRRERLELVLLELRLWGELRRRRRRRKLLHRRLRPWPLLRHLPEQLQAITRYDGDSLMRCDLVSNLS